MEGLHEALTRTGRRQLKGTESPMQSKRSGLISIGEIAGGLRLQPATDSHREVVVGLGRPDSGRDAL